MEALENSFVQLLIDSGEEADSEDISEAPDGCSLMPLNQVMKIVKGSLTPVGPRLYNPISFYKLLMTDELVKLVIEESNCYGSAKYSTWSVHKEQEFNNFSIS
ncbi:unnamed protein product [Haemonchus placei]|uniref:LINES_N domain-containing protein n=1 Tax=Haemonchus placei TaxID=6290 RepID=A0A0N4WLL8_HAEPC|nr:unnamed protein product [Haemonchus placei]